MNNKTKTISAAPLAVVMCTSLAGAQRRSVMILIIIKAAVSAALSYFSGPLLAQMFWQGDHDIAGSFLAITYVLVFLWGYFSLSATAWALHFGGCLALVVGFFSIAIGGALMIDEACCISYIYENMPIENEFWILTLILVVAFLVFPIIDIVLIVKAIRDRD